MSSVPQHYVGVSQDPDLVRDFNRVNAMYAKLKRGEHLSATEIASLNNLEGVANDHSVIGEFSDAFGGSDKATWDHIILMGAVRELRDLEKALPPLPEDQ